MLEELINITKGNEFITKADLKNIIEMGQNYYKKENLTKEELENIYEDYCYQFNIEI